MTVSILNAQLTTLRNAGISNNPVVGIGNVLQNAGSWSSGGASVSRLADGATYTYWSVGAYPATAVYDLDSAATVNMVGIASHNLGTKGARVAPQYWDGAAWSNIGPTVTPADDQTIVWLGDDVSSDQYRLAVTDPGSAAADPVIGVAFFGRAYRFDQRFWSGYNEAIYPTEVKLMANQSGAHVIGTTVVYQGSAVQWNFEHLDPATLYSDDFAAFVSHFNSGEGFFCAWRPDDYDAAYYATRTGNPVNVLNGGPGNLRSLSLSMSVYNE